MWFNELEAAILSLDEHPERSPATPENPALRNLFFGKKPNVYRVIFSIGARARLVSWERFQVVELENECKLSENVAAPKYLKEMLGVAEILSDGIVLVRVDLFESEPAAEKHVAQLQHNM